MQRCVDVKSKVFIILIINGFFNILRLSSRMERFFWSTLEAQTEHSSTGVCCEHCAYILFLTFPLFVVALIWIITFPTDSSQVEILCISFIEFNNVTCFSVRHVPPRRRHLHGQHGAVCELRALRGHRQRRGGRGPSGAVG
jgi:hypothetical protein